MQAPVSEYNMEERNKLILIVCHRNIVQGPMVTKSCVSLHTNVHLIPYPYFLETCQKRAVFPIFLALVITDYLARILLLIYNLKKRTVTAIEFVFARPSICLFIWAVPCSVGRYGNKAIFSGASLYATSSLNHILTRSQHI